MYWILWNRNKMLIPILMLLRKIFGPKRVDVTEYWKRLPNEQFHDSYSSPNVIHVIKSRRMRYARHVAEGAKKCTQTFGWET
jgi:hypothetical protein